MSKETLPIIILVATLVILLVVFAVYLWEPIYELKGLMDSLQSAEDSLGEAKECLIVLDNRVAELEAATLDFDVRRDLARELLEKME